MLYAIGLDAVEISRFTLWHTFSQVRLLRIFSEREIAYCLSVRSKSAERFAVRFAAREALFKACFQAGFFNTIPVPFLRFCRYVEVIRPQQGSPYLQIAWDKIVEWNKIGEKSIACHDNQIFTQDNQIAIDILLSLTHTQTTAIAFVLIQKSIAQWDK